MRQLRKETDLKNTLHQISKGKKLESKSAERRKEFVTCRNKLRGIVKECKIESYINWGKKVSEIF